MLRNVKIGGIQRGDRRTAEEAQSTFHIITQNLERARDTRLSSSGEAESISAAQENGACTKTNRFYNIAASPNAAVHEHFGVAVDRGQHPWEHSQGGRRAVPPAATVIGDAEQRRSPA